MAGLGIIIPRAGGGTGPGVGDDGILTAGSLVLLDAVNSMASWPSAVPTNGDFLPNLAATRAQTVLGSTSAEVRPTYVTGSNASSWVMQRSAKGGLHGIVSKASGAIVGGRGVQIKLPDTVLAYILANPAHRFYMSLWDRVTRISGDTNAASMPFVAGIAEAQPSSANTYHAIMRSDTTRPITTSTVPATGLRPSTGAGSDVLGNAFRNVATSGKNGTLTDAMLGTAAQWGQVGLVASSPTALLFTSWIFYRFYLEDLTVSGRSYATVDAIDSGLYNAKMVVTGGTYVGDTFNDPATVLA